MYPSDPVIPGTYTDTAIIPPYGTNAYYLQDAYIQKYGIQYIPIAYLTSTSPVTPFSVTLTSITDSTVSGTFVGTVYDSPTPTIVTNGSFYVPF
ncbi:MAG TPA: hypothetical protein VK718_01880 [Ferruginibacter sp.]|nr:hypothetical protein [Ferruginibacter sp.]